MELSIQERLKDLRVERGLTLEHRNVILVGGRSRIQSSGPERCR